MRGVIFDLDQTLVDSTVAEDARRQRNWQYVYSLIPQFVLYPGMNQVFQYLRAHEHKVAIVSTSPSTYVRRVVNYFNMPVDVIIGYHDAPRKPSPEGMLLALQRLDLYPNDAISFGDRAIDIQASKAANIQCVACLWDTKEAFLLRQAQPDAMISSVSDILLFL